MKNFWREKSGNFGILTALLMVPLCGAAGVALDITRGMSVKADLQQAADSAALAAVADMSASVQAAKKMSGDGVIPVGNEEARHSSMAISAATRTTPLPLSMFR